MCHRRVRSFLEGRGELAQQIVSTRSGDLSLTELIVIDFSAPSGTLEKLLQAEDPWLVDFSDKAPMDLVALPIPDNPEVELRLAEDHPLDVKVSPLCSLS